MATSIDGNPAIVAAANTAAELTLNPGREYTLQHMAVDVSESADTNAIFLAVNATPTASYAADTNKAVLQSGKALVIGPHVESLKYITASGAPVFMVIPGPPRGFV